jgi:hypothetical protein
VCAFMHSYTYLLIIFFPWNLRLDNEILQSPHVLVTQKKSTLSGTLQGYCTYQLRWGCCSSPASHPCTGASEQGPSVATPHGWSQQSDPWRKLISERICLIFSN